MSPVAYGTGLPMEESVSLRVSSVAGEVLCALSAPLFTEPPGNRQAELPGKQTGSICRGVPVNWRVPDKGLKSTGSD